MTQFRNRCKSLVWLALLAICGVAFGPTVSRIVLAAPAAGAARMAAHATEMAGHRHAHMAVASDLAAGMAAATDDRTDCHGRHVNALDCCALCAVAASPFTAVASFVPAWLQVERAPPPRPVQLAFDADRYRRWSRAAPRGPPSVA